MFIKKLIDLLYISVMLQHIVFVYMLYHLQGGMSTTVKKNSVALVRERTIPTERPPPVGEVVPTFTGRGVSRGQRNESPRPFSVF